MGGATNCLKCSHVRRWDFNPRSPWGERHRSTLLDSQKQRFQSTLPVGGATSSASHKIADLLYFNPRSPWGERPTFWRNLHICANFNPRSPWGERPLLFQNVPGAVCISIHAPRGGSDSKSEGAKLRTSISIHAPRGGSDEHFKQFCGENTHFNPRSPWGERLRLIWPTSFPGLFQSTLPVGGAT